MDESRLVEGVLRCYPARWRRRHGAEAAELAALLMRDGTPAGSIAWSYLAGAAREWVTPRPGRRVSAMACALLVAGGSVGVSAGVLASTVPARAAITSQVPVIGQAPVTSQAPISSQAPVSSQVHGLVGCRPGLAESGPGVIAAAGRPQVIVWGGGHDRSC
jgi:hypothetical protein